MEQLMNTWLKLLNVLIIMAGNPVDVKCKSIDMPLTNKYDLRFTVINQWDEVMQFRIYPANSKVFLRIYCNNCYQGDYELQKNINVRNVMQKIDAYNLRQIQNLKRRNWV